MGKVGSVIGVLAVIGLLGARVLMNTDWGKQLLYGPPPEKLKPLPRLETRPTSPGSAAAGSHLPSRPVDLTPVRRADLRPLPIKLTPLRPLKPQARGRMVFSYQGSDDPNDYSAVTFVLNSSLFQSLSDEVFRLMPLREDLPVVVAQCGQANAYWDPGERVIVLCSELLDAFYAVFQGIEDPAEQRQAVDGALLFTLTHELGHAAADLLDLRLTGNGEDNADQFATLMLLQMGTPGLRAVYAASDWFQAMGRAELRAGHIPFWDEHGLNLERFVNLLCYLYGRDPFGNAFLVGPRLLPPERAARCGREFQDMRAGWKHQLDGHLKQPIP